MLARSMQPSALGRQPLWWGLFGSWLGLTEHQSGRLWRLVSTSRHPAVRAWRMTAVFAAGYVGGREQAVALLGGPLAPQRVVAVLERLVVDRQLTRQEATRMEEAILEQTTKSGVWT